MHEDSKISEGITLARDRNRAIGLSLVGPGDYRIELMMRQHRNDRTRATS